MKLHLTIEFNPGTQQWLEDVRIGLLEHLTRGQLVDLARLVSDELYRTGEEE